MVAIPYSPIVVNTGSKLILIDTGFGEAKAGSKPGATNGQMMNNMRAAIDPKNRSISS